MHTVTGPVTRRLFTWDTLPETCRYGCSLHYLRLQPLLPTVAGRERTLHHVKLAAGIVPEVGVITSGTVPEGGAAAAGGGAPLCAWLLAGSHNLSGAAWGKVEEVKAEGREGETDLRVRLSSFLQPYP